LSNHDSSSSIPFGYCQCGCGEKTNLAPRTYTCYGVFKGQPLRYIRGHQRRSNPANHYKVEQRGYETPCWMWQLGKNKAGYGSIRRGGSNSTPAHRWYYEQLFGPIPAGLELHHRCENKTCVNPQHLQILTHEEHSSLHGRRDRGKLNIKKAKAIRTLYTTTQTSHKALAKQFGVSKRAVTLVLNYKTWKP
jgi:hypothetical protein